MQKVFLSYQKSHENSLLRDFLSCAGGKLRFETVNVDDKSYNKECIQKLKDCSAFVSIRNQYSQMEEVSIAYLFHAISLQKPVIILNTTNDDWASLINTDMMSIDLNHEPHITFNRLFATMIRSSEFMPQDNEKGKRITEKRNKPDRNDLFAVVVNVLLERSNRSVQWLADALLMDEELLSSILDGDFPIEELDDEFIEDLSKVFRLPVNVFRIILGHDITPNLSGAYPPPYHIWEGAVEDAFGTEDFTNDT